MPSGLLKVCLFFTITYNIAHTNVLLDLSKDMLEECVRNGKINCLYKNMKLNTVV